MKTLRRFGALAGLLLAGCTTPWVEDTSGDWRTLVATLDSNSSGNIRAVVRPEPGESNMLVSFRPIEADLLTHLRFLQVGPDVVYRATDETADSNPYSRSSAAYVSGATTMNWPISPDDGPMSEELHTFVTGAVDSSRQYTKGSAEVGVLLKSDPDLTSGLLKVNLIYGGRTVADDDIVRAVDAAVEIWRDIYATVGISLDITLYEYEHGILQAPGQGNPVEYEELARTTRFGGVNLIILEEIDGFAGALGFAGNIPGPLTSTEQSAVAVSATLSAGTDGRFDDTETALLGETMAHEVGHFLGLYHPVEATFQQWDSLDDTAECDREIDCVQALGSNLMYPYPICDSNGCLPQQDVTQAQGAVANRYTGVL